MSLFPGFANRRIRTSGATINVRVGGSGVPLLLLHGYPQTHAMWHKVAPQLAREFTVVCPDLRGYGESSKPRGLPDHANYSKRAMALDMVEVMESLGYVAFHLAGHDRGGRVAHRLARDHGRRVRSLAVLDISPTLKMYESTSMQFAKAYYHWFFLIQPAPLPERMISSVGVNYILGRLGRGKSGLGHFAEAPLVEAHCDRRFGGQVPRHFQSCDHHSILGNQFVDQPDRVALGGVPQVAVLDRNISPGHSGIFASFLEVTAGLIFFVFNGHHLLIQALLSSFTLFPLAGEKFFPHVVAGLIGSAVGTPLTLFRNRLGLPRLRM